MRLRRVHLENCGPLIEADLPLDERINVIVGVNGAGKTTALKAIAQMLGRYVSSVRTGRVSGAALPSGIVRKGESFARVTVEAEADGTRFEWVGIKRRTGYTDVASDSGQLISWVRTLTYRLEREAENASLPLVAYYSVNRAVLDIPLRIRKRMAHDQFAALEGALTEASSNFRTFFAWFRDREDVENERRAEDGDYRDRELVAVRYAIQSLLPGFAHLRVRRQPLRMLISKNGVDLRVDQLSDGEKVVLALAGDLARRLVLANPAATRPLEGPGIILIDELELHLHPGWQRWIVEALRDTFPKCQFIVSSHSPQVVSEAPNAGVFLLVDGRIKRAVKAHGLESGQILEELMGEPSRPDWAKKKIDALYEAIDDEEYDAARGQLDEIANLIGRGDPALTAAISLLRRRPASE